MPAGWVSSELRGRRPHHDAQGWCKAQDKALWCRNRAGLQAQRALLLVPVPPLLLLLLPPGSCRHGRLSRRLHQWGCCCQLLEVGRSAVVALPLPGGYALPGSFASAAPAAATARALQVWPPPLKLEGGQMQPAAPLALLRRQVCAAGGQAGCGGLEEQPTMMVERGGSRAEAMGAQPTPRRHANRERCLNCPPVWCGRRQAALPAPAKSCGLLLCRTGRRCRRSSPAQWLVGRLLRGWAAGSPRGGCSCLLYSLQVA